MIRIIVIAAALFAPFLFPYPFTLVLSFAASLFFLPIAVVVGALTDLVYYTSAASAFPLALIVGAFISCVAFLVRRFARARLLSI